MKDDQYDSNQPNNAIKTSNRSGTEKSAASSIQTIKKRRFWTKSQLRLHLDLHLN